MLIISSLLLALIIFLAEWVRKPVRGKIDFLRFASFVFFLAYVVSPVYLFLVQKYQIYSFSGYLKNFDALDVSNVYAQGAALLGYICLVFGFHISSGFLNYFLRLKREDGSEPIQDIPNYDIIISGTVLGLISLAAFFMYSLNLGGVTNFVKYSAALRSGETSLAPKFAFLKHFLPFSFFASYFFFSVSNKSSQKKNLIIKSLFVLFFILSLLFLYHMAGRLSLIAYLMIFPMVKVIQKNKIGFKFFFLSLAIFFIVVLFGQQIFHLLIDSNTLVRRFDLLTEKNFSILNEILLEFTFPFVTLSDTIFHLIPKEMDFRYFVDFILAIFILVPERLFEIDLPYTISQVNTLHFGTSGTVPVDLISFGYFSLGILGIVICTFGFGMMLRLFEGIFRPSGHLVLIVLRVAWIFFLGFRIMYADPAMAIFQGFYLICGTLFFYIVMALSKNINRYSPQESRV